MEWIKVEDALPVEFAPVFFVTDHGQEWAGFFTGRHWCVRSYPRGCDVFDQDKEKILYWIDAQIPSQEYLDENS